MPVMETWADYTSQVFTCWLNFRGLTHAEIADAMCMSPNTATSHMHLCLRATGARDRTQLVLALLGIRAEE